jgi:hypothetical protein
VDFEVQLKLAKYVPNLVAALDVSYEGEEFGDLFSEKKSKPLKDFSNIEKKLDGSYRMDAEPQEPDSIDQKKSKQSEHSDDSEKSTEGKSLAKSSSRKIQTLASMFYQIDALPIPLGELTQFVKEVLNKAIVEVQKSEGTQYKFSFDKQDIPLEISIKKSEKGLEIKLNVNKELYDILKPELNNLYAYLKTSNSEEIVMDLNLVEDDLFQEDHNESDSSDSHDENDSEVDDSE